jgi:hypothetical protein
MVIRITWGKLRAGAWNDFERTYREIMAPLQPFFVGEHKTYRCDVKYSDVGK